MSSPIHHPKDLDAALMYAPPWAREVEQAVPIAPAEPTLERTPSKRYVARVSPTFVGDRAMLDLQRRLSLDPERIPEPPPDDARTLGPIALRLGAAAGVAALVAWGMVSFIGTKKPVNEVVQAGVQPPPAVKSVKLVHVRSAITAPPAPRDGFADENQPSPRADALPLPPVQTASAPQPVGAEALDSDEIARLVKRGKDLLTNGDVASARLLLRRAAIAGNAEAALALGATYDPLIIQQLGALGVTPDTAQARAWYQAAVELGSEVASQRLAKLAQSR